MQNPDTPSLADLRADLVFAETLRGHRLTFHSTWGLFSPKQVDDGSRLLLDHVEIEPQATVLDVGCGYGTLGLTLAKLAPQGQVHLVDKDFVAVHYAEANAQRNGLANCQAYLSNGLSHVPDRPFDLIVSNLPAKVGNELLLLLLADAHARLRPGGRLYLVTISGLRQFIRRTVKDLFGNYTKVKQSRTHTVASAVR